MTYLSAVICLLALAVGSIQSASLTTQAPVTCSWDQCTEACGGGRRTCTRSNGKVWRIDCSLQSCDQDDGCGHADVVLVLDSSISLGERNWWITKQYAIDVTKGLNMAPDKSRVAVVTYSDDATTHIELDTYSKIDDFEKKVWNLDWEAGTTNTQDGLIHAQRILNETARPGVKHIVIVLTDGESNVKKDNTIPKAQEMHAQGIEIFAIGIGSIDETELKGIASEPLDMHYHYVSDYGSLTAITQTVINETCTAAKGIDCDPWSNWSDCKLKPGKKCGNGVKYRYQICRFYLYPGQTNPYTRTKVDNSSCSIPCPTSPPPPQPTTPSERCKRCTYDDYGVGYLPVNENCRLFIMCQRTQDGGYIEIEKTCGDLYWRQDLLTCDYAPEDGRNCTIGPVVTAAPDAPRNETCDKSPGPKKYQYIWHVGAVDYVMPCPPGTVFSKKRCKCVNGDNKPKKCSSDAMLEFPFNTHYDDICNRAAGTVFGKVDLVNGSAFFDGKSRVEIGYLKNWFAENPTQAMSVSLWFRRPGGDKKVEEGLFSNGDCVDAASLGLYVGNGKARGQVIASSRVRVGGKWNFKNNWNFVVLVYSGWDVKYFVNGQQTESKPLNGDIANTQCAANVGFSGLNNEDHFFNGYIDDVRIYRKVLYQYSIDQLFQNGRQ